MSSETSVNYDETLKLLTTHLSYNFNNPHVHEIFISDICDQSSDSDVEGFEITEIYEEDDDYRRVTEEERNIVIGKGIMNIWMSYTYQPFEIAIGRLNEAVTFGELLNSMTEFLSRRLTEEEILQLKINMYDESRFDSIYPDPKKLTVGHLYGDNCQFAGPMVRLDEDAVTSRGFLIPKGYFVFNVE